MSSRPAVLTIISIFCLLAGLFSLLLVGVSVSNPYFAEQYAMQGASPWLVLFIVFTVSLLMLATGIFIWTGNTKGWYLGIFTGTMLVTRLMASSYTMLSLGASIDISSHIRNAAMGLFILVILCKEKNREYFDVQDVPILKTILVSAGISILIMIVSTLLNSVLSSF